MRLLAAFSLVAACGSSGRSSPAGDHASAGSPPPADDRPCSVRAAELATWVQSIEPDGDATSIATDHLAAAPDAPLATGGRHVLLMITRDHVILPGAAEDDLPAIRAELARTHDLGDDAPTHVRVAVSRDAPIERVIGLTDALVHDGYNDLDFAFAGHRTSEPPPRSSVSDQLDAIKRDDPALRATGLAKVTEATIASCPGWASLLSSGVGDAPADTSRRIASGIAGATTSCDCKLDLDAMRSILWGLFGPGDRVPATIVGVHVYATDEHGDVITARGATWADVAPIVIRAGGHAVQFVDPEVPR